MPEGGNQTPITPGFIQRATQGLLYTIAPTKAKEWFGPMQPLQPMAQEATEGRRFDFQTGYNLNQSPRGYEPVTFEDLRNLGDSCDILRAVIETRKDQMEAFDWAFRIKKSPSSLGKVIETDEQKKNIDELTQFFMSPDKEHSFSQWLRAILEDMFVIDAVAIYKRRTRGGKLYSLDLIDGATIKLLLDDTGRTPAPPSPAYQQILHGIPANDLVRAGVEVENFNRNELLYLRHNLRTNKVYGYSHVEQIIMTVNVAVRRSLSQLEYYKDGSQPDAFGTLPKEWNADQIKAFQSNFDAMLAGNSAMRRRMKFMPSDFSYVPTKENPIKDEYDEWLARLICFTFSISPQALVKEMNRATATTAQDAALEEGLVPLQKRVKNMIDSIIYTEFGIKDIEFAWTNDRETDPKVASEIRASDVSKAIISVDEAREQLGLSPLGGAYAIPQSLGGAFVAVTSPEDQKAAAEAAGQSQYGFGGSAPEGGVPESEEEKVKDNNTQNENGETPEGKVDVDKKHSHGMEDYGRLKKKENYLTTSRPLIVKNKQAYTKTIQKVFKKTAEDVAEQIRKELTKVSKLDTPEDNKVKAAAIADSINLQLMSALASEDEFMSDAAIDAGYLTLGSVKATTNNNLVNQVNTKAANFARNRAAEMVGKKWVNGKLVNDPNAQMVITDTTRDMIRSAIANGLDSGLTADDIADDIGDITSADGQRIFGEDRAARIAYTEINRANGEGAVIGMSEARDAGLNIGKYWYPDAEACDICLGNADDGVIDLDEEFSSGDTTTPAHVNCECVILSAPLDGEPGDDFEEDDFE